MNILGIKILEIDFSRKENSMIVKSKFPCRDKQCMWRIVDNEAIIFSEEGQWLHQLNNVGTEIWNMCDGTLTFAEIADKMCDKFEVEKEIVEADIQSFVEELSKKGLITLKE